jgi:hypothetical protein
VLKKSGLKASWMPHLNPSPLAKLVT